MEKKQVYRCGVCGNLVEALWESPVEVKCCNQTMQKLTLNTTDASKEKHVPVIERSGTRVTVKVGSAPHPMTPEHYILFIELLAGDQILRHDLKKGDTKAEAVFTVPEGVALQARAYCNLHGFWASI